MVKKAVKRRKVRAKPLPQPAFPPPPVQLATQVNPLGETEQRKIVRSSVAESVYTLSDGTKLILKPLIADVRRAVGQFNENGKPVYFLTVANTIDTKPPKSLMQKKSAKKQSK